MPTVDVRTGEHVEAIEVELPDGLDVRRVVVTHDSVSFFGGDEREAVLVQRTTYPGGGLDVQFADHVRTG